MDRSTLNNRMFIGALIAVSVGFLVLLKPFFQAIFWATTLAILFWPIHGKVLDRMPGRPILAAAISLVACVLIVVVPLLLVGLSLVSELALLYARIANGGGISAYLKDLDDAGSPWIKAWLDRLHTDELALLQERISQGAAQAVQFALARVVDLGQNTLQLAVGVVLALYLLFFFFLDGERIARAVRAILPMDSALVGQLGSKFETVVKATVRGNLVVAAVQGGLGGLMFWVLGVQGAVLWGVIMVLLSLLPAVGAWLVWGPVAIYLLASGSITKGLIMVAFGAGVIGLIDNVLRPILVGKETRMPDYLVLLSTLGGLSLFGLTGFVAGPVVAALFMAMWEILAARVDAAPKSVEPVLGPQALVRAGADGPPDEG